MIFDPDFSQEEKVIYMYLDGWSVPAIADATGVIRINVAIIIGLIKQNYMAKKKKKVGC